jgi:hypothetical protein
MRNLSYSAVTKRYKPDGSGFTVAAGTGDVLTGDTIDSLGFSGVRFVVGFGTITATGTDVVKVQGSDDGAAWGDVSMVTVPGSTTNASVSLTAAADSAKMTIIELYKSKFRYFRTVITRATANSVIDFALVELHNSDNMPVTQDATVSASSPVVLNAAAHA